MANNKKKGKGKNRTNSHSKNNRNNVEQPGNKRNNKNDSTSSSLESRGSVSVNDDIFGDTDKRVNLNYDNDGGKKSSRNNEVNVGAKEDDRQGTNPPKGLNNLGNTCYFNSVMQVISQTHLLYDLLNSRSNEGFEWTAKGLLNQSSWTFEKQYDEELDVILPSCYPLAQTLNKFMREMRSPNAVRTVNPSSLLKDIQKKWAQFEGCSQQDSHELLRCLLDSLRCDEIKRQRKGIMSALKISIGNQSNLDDDTKSRCKSFANFSSSTIIDQVFSGLIISSIICQECSNVSQIFEPFFDLSLPINEEKAKMPKKNEKQTNRSRKSSEVEDNEVIVKEEKSLINEDSKNLTPKDRRTKRQQKKAAKREAKQKKKADNNISISHDLGDDDDLEVKDNEVDETKIVEGTTEDLSNEANELEKKGEMVEIIVTPPAKEVREEEEEEEEECESQEMVNEVSILMNDLIDLVVEKEKEDRSRLELEMGNVSLKETQENGFCSSKDCDADIEDNVANDTVFEDACTKQVDENDLSSNFELLSISDKDKLSLVNSECTSEMKKLIIRKTLLPISSRSSRRTESTCSTSSTHASSNTTLQSCLSHFFTPELMIGPNKICCEVCTRRNGGTKAYKNASKQTLIAIPPPILTLHLKRFEAEGYKRANLRKINRSVAFPAIIDLAPYTSKMYNQITPLTQLKKVNSILYSLYGVVEHGGTLRSGHYTSYIKVRKNNPVVKTFALMSPFIPKLDQVLNMIEQFEFKRETQAQSQNTNETNTNETSTNGKLNGNTHECNIDLNGHESEGEDEIKSKLNEDIIETDGKWFHISDSSVRSVNLNAVLHSQAYLLFYERIC